MKKSSVSKISASSDVLATSPHVDVSNAPDLADPRFPQLQQELLHWFAAHGRPLPWRAHYNPYATWIAEVMMQQTQMERGVDYYLRWMARFPDVHAVAKADEQDVLKAWEGLGYYRRARNIQAAAQVIVREHNGIFPKHYRAIAALPGIGPYTAGAIMSTTYNEPVPSVDGNVERVLARVFDIDSPVKVEPAKSRIYNLAKALIPQGQARDFNQALMELGALVCRKKAQCHTCPLAKTALTDTNQPLCESYRLGIVQERPVLGRTTTSIPVEVVTGVLWHGNNVFIQRRPEQGIWAGLWEFPGGRVEPGESPEQAIVREWREELEWNVEVRNKIIVIRHGYTSYRLTLHCFNLNLKATRAAGQNSSTGTCLDQNKGTCLDHSKDTALTQGKPTPLALNEATAWAWVPLEDLPVYPMPAPHRKLADLLQTP